MRAHGVNLIAIGNGTASRETDKLAADLIKRISNGARHPDREGRGVGSRRLGYSASEFASKELPDLDVSLRGAVSIARRLQDPLAELVKIDPKALAWASTSTTSTRAKWPHAGCCGGRLRELRGRGLEHGFGPLAVARIWPEHTVANSIVRWRDANGAFKTASS